MSEQSKWMSLVESFANVVVGIGVGFMSNIVILPLMGFAIHFGEALVITILMTIISIVRSYIMRRVFERIRVRGMNVQTATE